MKEWSDEKYQDIIALKQKCAHDNIKTISELIRAIKSKTGCIPAKVQAFAYGKDSEFILKIDSLYGEVSILAYCGDMGVYKFFNMSNTQTSLKNWNKISRLIKRALSMVRSCNSKIRKEVSK